jgi:predicted amidohydrolase
MRVALVQQRVAAPRPAATLAEGLAHCARAREGNADLVVFPELWHTGYAPCPPDGPGRAAWLDLAIGLDDPWLREFQRCAQRLRLAVVVTFLRRAGDAVTDAAAVFDADGQLVLVHDKVHVCDFSWEAVLTAGEQFAVGPVATRTGTVALGVMTCFDREFPESARALALAGAELIACPNACLLCDDRIGQVRARAFENMVAVAVANYPIPAMNGRSCFFDGIASAGNRPRDHQVVLAGPRAGLVFADLDLDALRHYRAGGLWQPARRRPRAYRVLTDTVHSGGTRS